MEDRVELVTDVEVTTPTIEEARRSLHPCNSPLVASILPSWRSLRPDSEAPPDTLSSKGLMSWLKDLCQRATRAVYVHHPSPLLKAVISEYPVLSRTTNMRAKCQTYLNRTGSHPCQIDGGKLGHIAQYVAEVSVLCTSRVINFTCRNPVFLIYRFYGLRHVLLFHWKNLGFQALVSSSSQRPLRCRAPPL
jgi:hypothetical protein